MSDTNPGRTMLRIAWRPEKHGSFRQLATDAGCDFVEVEEAMRHGRGPVDGKPEPRVIHALCKRLGVDYIECMKAFGHVIESRKDHS